MEFAITGTFLVMMMMFLLEIGWQMAVGVALEHGARAAGRYGITGQTGSGSSQSTRGDQIRQSVLDAAGGMLLSARLTLADTGYSSFANASANSGGAAGAGTASQVTLYDLTYVQPCIAWSFSSCSFTHRAQAMVQNEPFPN